jgi:hypothetical protein
MNMKTAVCISFMALLLIPAGPARSATTDTPEIAVQAFAQGEKPSAAQRVRHWTRTRLESAKKRWARNNLKFSMCTKELVEIRKTKRVGLRAEGRFLENCMNRP